MSLQISGSTHTSFSTGFSSQELAAEVFRKLIGSGRLAFKIAVRGLEGKNTCCPAQCSINVPAGAAAETDGAYACFADDPLSCSPGWTAAERNPHRAGYITDSQSEWLCLPHTFELAGPCLFCLD